jgi:hypothetical protein
MIIKRPLMKWACSALVIGLIVVLRRADSDYIAVLLLKNPPDQKYVVINQIIPDAVSVVICATGHQFPLALLICCLIFANREFLVDLFEGYHGPGSGSVALIKESIYYVFPYIYSAYILIVHLIIYNMLKAIFAIRDEDC